MLILERPFVSEELAAYAAEQSIPVLDNAFARVLASRFNVNLVPDTEFIDRLNRGGRLYTVSENALEWVVKNAKDKDLLEIIHLMKDKAAMRRTLAPLFPDFRFRPIPAAQLEKLDVSDLTMPCILKPAIGFFSVGVHTITNGADWQNALATIRKESSGWKDLYPASVLGESEFILEEFIRGEEYAIDVYFDDEGKAIILNIMKHDFTSEEDVSDSVYYTSKEIIESNLARFTDFLNRNNTLLHARNFPAHVEVRVTGEGRITPIEYNPLRFAGWCCTDLSRYAFGFRTYQYYLENRAPDWNTLLRGKEDKLYAFAVLAKPSVDLTGKRFDFEAAGRLFTRILHTRPMDDPAFPMFGLLFTETPVGKRDELDRFMRADLTEYLVEAG